MTTSSPAARLPSNIEGVRPTIDLVAGARPNFMKLAPVQRALRSTEAVRVRIVHTGQHYDRAMNEVFFSDLGIPEPDAHLNVGSGSHGQQTARILERYEALVLKDPPVATVVFGDVNSTIACALASVKLGVGVAHVEAGLRSFDRTMPEEINRILVDSVADLLLVSEESGVQNLRHEGVDESRIKFVGNVMIDTLAAFLGSAEDSVHNELGLSKGEYGLVTLHRPSNVDDVTHLERLLRLLRAFAIELPLVFPIHPRTRKAVTSAGLDHLLDGTPNLHCIPPAPYRTNLALMKDARVVLTDSGGMQEETTILQVPCITLRENTERPVTTTLGTSVLVGKDPERIRAAFNRALSGTWPTGSGVPLWDGHASERVASELLDWLGRCGQ
jgi:UDP-N-acetylglucosamine 2-epimerase (non-hydrolysing)